MSDREAAAQEARRWMRFAWEDLDAAHKSLSERSSTPRHVCMFAQQSAEKAVKGALTLEGTESFHTRTT